MASRGWRSRRRRRVGPLAFPVRIGRTAGPLSVRSARHHSRPNEQSRVGAARAPRKEQRGRCRQPRSPPPPRSSRPVRRCPFKRFFTSPGRHPFDAVEWERRDARIGHGDRVAFEQRDVEFPKSWSQNATNIVAQKYFRGQLGSPRARALGQADDRPRRRHDRRLGPRARLLRERRGRRRLRGRARRTSCSTRWRRSTRRSGSTWASRSSPQCSACQPYHALDLDAGRHGPDRRARRRAIRSAARSTTLAA